MAKTSAALLAAVLVLASVSGGLAQDAGYQAPKTPDGDPDLNGIWQAMNSAHWDLEAHQARRTPAPEVGALGAIPAGLSVVGGGTIPYQEWALERRNANRADWLRLDPAVKCFMPGIPRANYMPLPFQIVQTPKAVFFGYEWGGNSRVVRLDRPGTRAALPSWMGHSLGHWEGDTLVVEVTDQVADTWFDASGNFHSEELRVVERFTPTGPNSLLYEAAITDPKVFTEPWTISMPLYRRLETNARILEFKCIPLGGEDAAYGHLRRGAASRAEGVER